MSMVPISHKAAATTKHKARLLDIPSRKTLDKTDKASTTGLVLLYRVTGWWCLLV